MAVVWCGVGSDRRADLEKAWNEAGEQAHSERIEWDVMVEIAEQRQRRLRIYLIMEALAATLPRTLSIESRQGGRQYVGRLESLQQQREIPPSIKQVGARLLDAFLRAPRAILGIADSASCGI